MFHILTIHIDSCPWACVQLIRFVVLTTVVSLATEVELQSSVLLSRQMTPPLWCLLQSHVFPLHALFTHSA